MDVRFDVDYGYARHFLGQLAQWLRKLLNLVLWLDFVLPGLLGLGRLLNS